MCGEGFSINFTYVENENGCQVGGHYTDTDGADVSIEHSGNNPDDVLAASISDFAGQILAGALLAETKESEENTDDGTFDSWEEERKSLLDDLYNLSQENEQLTSQLKDKDEEIQYWKDVYMKTANHAYEETQSWKENYISVCKKLNEAEIKIEDLEDKVKVAEEIYLLIMP